jgi:acyl-CoA reductase-like NAD-dependent aldehyde dehydrogenase
MSSTTVLQRPAATEPTEIRMLIGGKWRPAADSYPVRDPYRGTVVSHAPRSSLADLDDALNAAVGAKAKAAATPAYERAALLRRAGKLLVERADATAEIMARETGNAVKDAKAEIIRSQDTLSLSAEEAVRIEGEHVPLDASAMGAGKICFMLRFPVGVVAAITPFNAPFNLACHKIAPAIAAGNTLVLKAPPQSPGVIHALAQIFVDAGTPAGVLNVLYGETVGPALVRDPRVDFITFTGPRASAPKLRRLPAYAVSRLNSAATARPSCMKTRQSTKPLRYARATPCGLPDKAASRCRLCMSTVAFTIASSTSSSPK